MCRGGVREDECWVVRCGLRQGHHAGKGMEGHEPARSAWAWLSTLTSTFAAASAQRGRPQSAMLVLQGWNAVRVQGAADAAVAMSLARLSGPHLLERLFGGRSSVAYEDLLIGLA